MMRRASTGQIVGSAQLYIHVQRIAQAAEGPVGSLEHAQVTTEDLELTPRSDSDEEGPSVGAVLDDAGFFPRSPQASGAGLAGPPAARRLPSTGGWAESGWRVGDEEDAAADNDGRTSVAAPVLPAATAPPAAAPTPAHTRSSSEIPRGYALRAEDAAPGSGARPAPLFEREAVPSRTALVSQLSENIATQEALAREQRERHLSRVEESGWGGFFSPPGLGLGVVSGRAGGSGGTGGLHRRNPSGPPRLITGKADESLEYTLSEYKRQSRIEARSRLSRDGRSSRDRSRSNSPTPHGSYSSSSSSSSTSSSPSDGEQEEGNEEEGDIGRAGAASTAPFARPRDLTAPPSDHRRNHHGGTEPPLRSISASATSRRRELPVSAVTGRAENGSGPRPTHDGAEPPTPFRSTPGASASRASSTPATPAAPSPPSSYRWLRVDVAVDSTPDVVIDAIVRHCCIANPEWIAELGFSGDMSEIPSLCRSLELQIHDEDDEDGLASGIAVDRGQAVKDVGEDSFILVHSESRAVVADVRTEDALSTLGSPILRLRYRRHESESESESESEEHADGDRDEEDGDHDEGDENGGGSRAQRTRDLAHRSWGASRGRSTGRYDATELEDSSDADGGFPDSHVEDDEVRESQEATPSSRWSRAATRAEQRLEDQVGSREDSSLASIAPGAPSTDRGSAIASSARARRAVPTLSSPLPSSGDILALAPMTGRSQRSSRDGSVADFVGVDDHEDANRVRAPRRASASRAGLRPSGDSYEHDGRAALGETRSDRDTRWVQPLEAHPAFPLSPRSRASSTESRSATPNLRTVASPSLLQDPSADHAASPAVLPPRATLLSTASTKSAVSSDAPSTDTNPSPNTPAARPPPATAMGTISKLFAAASNLFSGRRASVSSSDGSHAPALTVSAAVISAEPRGGPEDGRVGRGESAAASTASDGKQTDTRFSAHSPVAILERKSEEGHSDRSRSSTRESSMEPRSGSGTGSSASTLARAPSGLASGDTSLSATGPPSVHHTPSAATSSPRAVSPPYARAELRTRGQDTDAPGAQPPRVSPEGIGGGRRTPVAPSRTRETRSASPTPSPRTSELLRGAGDGRGGALVVGGLKESGGFLRLNAGEDGDHHSGFVPALSAKEPSSRARSRFPSTDTTDTMHQRNELWAAGSDAGVLLGGAPDEFGVDVFEALEEMMRDADQLARGAALIELYRAKKQDPRVAEVYGDVGADDVDPVEDFIRRHVDALRILRNKSCEMVGGRLNVARQWRNLVLVIYEARVHEPIPEALRSAAQVIPAAPTPTPPPRGRTPGGNRAGSGSRGLLSPRSTDRRGAKLAGEDGPNVRSARRSGAARPHSDVSPAPDSSTPTQTPRPPRASGTASALVGDTSAVTHAVEGGEVDFTTSVLRRSDPGPSVVPEVDGSATALESVGTTTAVKQALSLSMAEEPLPRSTAAGQLVGRGPVDDTSAATATHDATAHADTRAHVVQVTEPVSARLDSSASLPRPGSAHVLLEGAEATTDVHTSSLAPSTSAAPVEPNAPHRRSEPPTTGAEETAVPALSRQSTPSESADGPESSASSVSALARDDGLNKRTPFLRRRTTRIRRFSDTAATDSSKSWLSGVGLHRVSQAAVDVHVSFGQIRQLAAHFHRVSRVPTGSGGDSGVGLRHTLDAGAMGVNERSASRELAEEGDASGAIGARYRQLEVRDGLHLELPRADRPERQDAGTAVPALVARSPSFRHRGVSETTSVDADELVSPIATPRPSPIPTLLATAARISHSARWGPTGADAARSPRTSLHSAMRPAALSALHASRSDRALLGPRSPLLGAPSDAPLRIASSPSTPGGPDSRLREGVAGELVRAEAQPTRVSQRHLALVRWRVRMSRRLDTGVPGFTSRRGSPRWAPETPVSATSSSAPAGDARSEHSPNVEEAESLRAGASDLDLRTSRDSLVIRLREKFQLYGAGSLSHGTSPRLGPQSPALSGRALRDPGSLVPGRMSTAMRLMTSSPGLAHFTTDEGSPASPVALTGLLDAVRTSAAPKRVHSTRQTRHSMHESTHGLRHSPSQPDTRPRGPPKSMAASGSDAPTSPSQFAPSLSPTPGRSIADETDSSVRSKGLEPGQESDTTEGTSARGAERKPRDSAASYRTNGAETYELAHPGPASGIGVTPDPVLEVRRPPPPPPSPRVRAPQIASETPTSFDSAAVSLASPSYTMAAAESPGGDGESSSARPSPPPRSSHGGAVSAAGLRPPIGAGASVPLLRVDSDASQDSFFAEGLMTPSHADAPAHSPLDGNPLDRPEAYALPSVSVVINRHRSLTVPHMDAQGENATQFLDIALRNRRISGAAKSSTTPTAVPRGGAETAVDAHPVAGSTRLVASAASEHEAGRDDGAVSTLHPEDGVRADRGEATRSSSPHRASAQTSTVAAPLISSKTSPAARELSIHLPIRLAAAQPPRLLTGLDESAASAAPQRVQGARPPTPPTAATFAADESVEASADAVSGSTDTDGRTEEFRAAERGKEPSTPQTTGGGPRSARSDGSTGSSANVMSPLALPPTNLGKPPRARDDCLPAGEAGREAEGSAAHAESAPSLASPSLTAAVSPTSSSPKTSEGPLDAEQPDRSATMPAASLTPGRFFSESGPASLHTLTLTPFHSESPPSATLRTLAPGLRRSASDTAAPHPGLGALSPGTSPSPTSGPGVQAQSHAISPSVESGPSPQPSVAPISRRSSLRREVQPLDDRSGLAPSFAQESRPSPLTRGLSARSRGVGSGSRSGLATSGLTQAHPRSPLFGRSTASSPPPSSTPPVARGVSLLAPLGSLLDDRDPGSVRHLRRAPSLNQLLEAFPVRFVLRCVHGERFLIPVPFEEPLSSRLRRAASVLNRSFASGAGWRDSTAPQSPGTRPSSSPILAGVSAPAESRFSASSRSLLSAIQWLRIPAASSRSLLSHDSSMSLDDRNVRPDSAPKDPVHVLTRRAIGASRRLSAKGQLGPGRFDSMQSIADNEVLTRVSSMNLDLGLGLHQPTTPILAGLVDAGPDRCRKPSSRGIVDLTSTDRLRGSSDASIRSDDGTTSDQTADRDPISLEPWSPAPGRVRSDETRSFQGGIPDLMTESQLGSGGSAVPDMPVPPALAPNDTVTTEISSPSERTRASARPMVEESPSNVPVMGLADRRLPPEGALAAGSNASFSASSFASSTHSHADRTESPTGHPPLDPLLHDAHSASPPWYMGGRVLSGASLDEPPPPRTSSAAATAAAAAAAAESRRFSSPPRRSKQGPVAFRVSRTVARILTQLGVTRRGRTGGRPKRRSVGSYEWDRETATSFQSTDTLGLQKAAAGSARLESSGSADSAVAVGGGAGSGARRAIPPRSSPIARPSPTPSVLTMSTIPTAASFPSLTAAPPPSTGADATRTANHDEATSTSEPRVVEGGRGGALSRSGVDAMASTLAATAASVSPRISPHAHDGFEDALPVHHPVQRPVPGAPLSRVLSQGLSTDSVIHTPAGSPVHSPLHARVQPRTSTPAARDPRIRSTHVPALRTDADAMILRVSTEIVSLFRVVRAWLLHSATSAGLRPRSARELRTEPTRPSEFSQSDSRSHMPVIASTSTSPTSLSSQRRVLGPHGPSSSAGDPVSSAAPRARPRSPDRESQSYSTHDSEVSEQSGGRLRPARSINDQGSTRGLDVPLEATSHEPHRRQGNSSRPTTFVSRSQSNSSDHSSSRDDRSSSTRSSSRTSHSSSSTSSSSSSSSTSSSSSSSSTDESSDESSDESFDSDFDGEDTEDDDDDVLGGEDDRPERHGRLLVRDDFDDDQDEGQEDEDALDGGGEFDDDYFGEDFDYNHSDDDDDDGRGGEAFDDTADPWTVFFYRP